MTGQLPASGAAAIDSVRRCPACGQEAPAPLEGRCPACGERLHDADVTSDDHTPYASGLETGRPIYFAMCRWIYGAGKQRLAHLGLLRPSRAARRFARWGVIVFSFMMALSVFANTGWHEVRSGPAAIAGRSQPEGKGWWMVWQQAQESAARSDITAIWWNLPWATVAGVAALSASFVVSALLLAIIGRGAQRALRGRMRGATRLRCAVSYSTAWIHLLSAAALLLALVPLARWAAPLGWGRWPIAMFRIPAVLSAVAGVLCWWFWCLRMAQALPPETRTPVTRYFAIWAPLWSVLIAGGTVYGMWRGATPLAAALKLQW